MEGFYLSFRTIPAKTPRPPTSPNVCLLRRILPRAEQGAPGMIKDYKVYVKATGFDYWYTFPVGVETQTAEEATEKN